MSLSNDLISQFVKATKDDKQTKTETTVYGTIKEYNGAKYVHLDGAPPELLTPISSTTDAVAEERVTVMIKNHTAIVTGNISSPAARTDDVQEIGNKISDFEIVIADKVDTKQLNAQIARIDNLQSDNVIIKNTLTANEASISQLTADNATINEKLTANEADIGKIQTDKLDADIANVTYATIKDLEATNVEVNNLEATYGDFVKLTTEDVNAINATIDKLDTKYASIENLDTERARIDDLETNSLTADSAVVKDLQADVADIDTLIFGSASGDVIHTSFANAVIAQLGDAQIKSAMIDNLSASKISAGDILTNNVRVLSEDGKLLISDETIQISDDTRVRVQIGKDASGDYSINVWDVNGNLMFSEGGITDNAIKQAIIRDDMVSETANISASKLNIDSVFEEINGSTKTINSTKIYLDDEAQTLDFAFTSLNSNVGELKNKVSSQGTQLSVVQDNITSKIWQQDIDLAKGEITDEITDEMSTKYSTLEQELDGFKITVSETYSTKDDLANLESAIEQKADSITLQVSNEYTTKDEFNDLEVGGRNLITNSQATVTKELGDTQAEFIQYTDLAPIFDKYGLIEYTLSFDIKSADTTNTNRIQVCCQNGSGAKHSIGETYITVTTEYERHSLTFVPTIQVETETKSMLAFYGTYNTGNIPCVTNVKLEKGNKATDWTPAPEDVSEDISKAVEGVIEGTNADIAELQAAINLLSNNIQMIVTSTTEDGVTASKMTQDETTATWSFNTGEIDSNIEQHTQDIKDLQDSANTLSNKLSTWEEHVSITTYEDEPCLILREDDSPYEKYITNTRQIVKETSNGVSKTLSKIDKDSATYKKVTATETVQVGHFAWKRRGENRISLMWEGVVE